MTLVLPDNRITCKECMNDDDDDGLFIRQTDGQTD